MFANSSLESPQTPRKNPETRKRGTLAGLFTSMQITQQPVSNRKSRQLPAPINSAPPLAPRPSSAKLDIVIKRICIPDDARSILSKSIPQPSSNLHVTTDSNGRSETYYVNSDNQKFRGCCVNSIGLVKYCQTNRSCCDLCDPSAWIFQGSEYDPRISLLYAQMDGCIPSSILLLNPKFLIPWRYKNSKTKLVSWKLIHLCGLNVEDAEGETIVVNIQRDKQLRKIIETVKRESHQYINSDLVDYLLQVVQQALGDYGLEGGATSSQADVSLYNQMKTQGHNFLMLGSVKIGLCRHKALLFKIISDVASLDCALVTGYSTGGRHQWNVVTLMDTFTKTWESYIIDPTSPYFTWTKQGSTRIKAYKVQHDSSFGHGGITMKLSGIL